MESASAVVDSGQSRIERESTLNLDDKEHLQRLINIIEKDKINLGDVKRQQAEFDRRKSVPVDNSGLSQRVQTFYVDKWPQVNIKPGNKILAPSRQRMIGGTPISLHTAIELRKVVFGSTVHSFSREWRKSNLAFQDLDGPYPYGLQTRSCNSRGLALCVQGFMLKRLMFDREYASSIFTGRCLRPSSFERRKGLTEGICEMLWQAGEKRRCCLALLDEAPCFEPDYRYRFDNVTERLHLFEFKKLEDVQFFVKRNLERFQAENGCGLIMILYSLVLSRTVSKVWEDMGGSEDSGHKLLTDTEDLTYSLLNLAVTGCAVPHIHNGDILFDNKGHLLPSSLRGVKERAGMGFLFWDKGEDPDFRTEVGSMLKTPKTPIWLSKVNHMYGLLFSTNLDLVSDYRFENRFNLFYYTGLVSQAATATLTVETRIGRPARPKTTLGRRQEDRIPPLENCIMTKWYGANINWNGTSSFI